MSGKNLPKCNDRCGDGQRYLAADSIEGVLMLHVLGRPGFASEASCSCGWQVRHPRDVGGMFRTAQHRVHLAAAINAHLAQVAVESRTAVAEALLLEHMDGDMLVGAGRGIDNEGEDVAIGRARAAEVAFWAADAAVGAYLARVGAL